jgi:hypothetical protein
MTSVGDRQKAFRAGDARYLHHTGLAVVTMDAATLFAVPASKKCSGIYHQGYQRHSLSLEHVVSKKYDFVSR